jgi:hypothetical protein
VLQGDYVETWYVKLLAITSIKAVKCILHLLFDSPSYIRLFLGYLFYSLYENGGYLKLRPSFVTELSFGSKTVISLLVSVTIFFVSQFTYISIAA